MTMSATQATETPQTPTSAVPDRTPLMLGALYALLLANAVQIAAGMAQLGVSPPAEVLPLLAATVAIGIAAVPLVRAGLRHGLLLGIGFCALSLIGMGPHKLFLEDGLVIAPMALTGFAFEIVFVAAAIEALRSRP
jgi:hypothetical protein